MGKAVKSTVSLPEGGHRTARARGESGPAWRGALALSSQIANHGSTWPSGSAPDGPEARSDRSLPRTFGRLRGAADRSMLAASWEGMPDGHRRRAFAQALDAIPGSMAIRDGWRRVHRRRHPDRDRASRTPGGVPSIVAADLRRGVRRRGDRSAAGAHGGRAGAEPGPSGKHARARGGRRERAVCRGRPDGHPGGPREAGPCVLAGLSSISMIERWRLARSNGAGGRCRSSHVNACDPDGLGSRGSGGTGDPQARSAGSLPGSERAAVTASSDRNRQSLVPIVDPPETSATP
jgi:hypothetical protein